MRWPQGQARPHLVFDSQLTTYRNLAALNQRGITFITLRRRTPTGLREMAVPPRAAWRTVHLDVPHRLYQTPKVIDQRVRLRPYGPAPLRQLFIKDLGHEQPTVLLTNDLRATPAALIIRYARRMLIENGLADAVNFLHLDALSSAVALNVSFDVLLTTIATGLYRRLAQKLRGFERAQPRQIWRRFLTGGAFSWNTCRASGGRERDGILHPERYRKLKTVSTDGGLGLVVLPRSSTIGTPAVPDVELNRSRGRSIPLPPNVRFAS